MEGGGEGREGWKDASYLCFPAVPVFNVLLYLLCSAAHHWAVARVEGGGRQGLQPLEGLHVVPQILKHLQKTNKDENESGCKHTYNQPILLHVELTMHALSYTECKMIKYHSPAPSLPPFLPPSLLLPISVTELPWPRMQSPTNAEFSSSKSKVM